MKYERLKNNLGILKEHNKTHRPVFHITNGKIHEIDLINEIISDSKDLFDKIENGTLIELPCKVGDTVYQTDGVRIYQGKIGEIAFTKEHTIFTADIVCFDERAIGESIFLTKAEAEQKLKELKGEV